MPRPKNEIPPAKITLRIDSRSVEKLRTQAQNERLTLSDLMRQKLMR
jgi:hypothetical protein